MKSEIDNNLDRIILEVSEVLTVIESKLPPGTTHVDDEHPISEELSTFFDLSQTLGEIKWGVIQVQEELKEKTAKLKYFHQLLADKSLWE